MEKTLRNTLLEDHNIYNASQKRFAWVDISKGIAIISVILGNISDIPYLLKIMVFSFHIPLFFIISGFLLKNHDIKTTFSKSVKTLLKPYVVICLLEAIIAGLKADNFTMGGSNLYNCLNDLIVCISKTSKAFTQYESVGVVWFVGCLFIAKNLYVLICNISAKRCIQYIIVFLVAVLGYFIGKEIAFLPWSIDVAMVSLIFIAVGDSLHSALGSSKRTKIIAMILSLIIWVLLLHKSVWIELAARKYTHDILSVVCAIAGSIVVISLGKGIEKIHLLSPAFSWLGKNSLIILAFHCFEMRFFNWNDWVYNPLGISPDWILTFIIHATIIILATAIYNVIRKALNNLNNHLIATKKETNRIDWPDVAKGICIISVILGHLGVAWINKIVYMYHLPVFFIISGYFLKKNTNLIGFAKTKAKRLLIPYAMTCIIGGIISAIRLDWSVSANREWWIYKWFYGAFYGAGDSWESLNIKGIGAIWFLLALFFAYIIVNCFIEKKYYQVIIVCIAYIGWASFDRTQVWLPMSIQAGMFASIYLLIGYEARKNGFSMTNMGILPLGICAIIAAFSIQHFKGLWLVHNDLRNGWFDFFGSIAASVVVIVISKKISESNEWIKRALQFFGKNSLVIMCIHFIDIEVISSSIKQFSSTITDLLSLNENHSMILLIMMKVLYVTIVVVVINQIKSLYKNQKYVTQHI